jgi:pyridoxamine 5'-phosphate oxidase
MEEFLQQIRNDHHNFDKGNLSDHLGDDPISFFKTWFKEAIDEKVFEPQSMHISTVDHQQRPSARIVYLKEILNEKFIFYTNYSSQKGKDLANNNAISALFFWPSQERQIRIEGFATKIKDQISDAYFESRPRASQLGAWASYQSEKLEARKELELRVEALAKEFPNQVPRPPHWGGYEIEPTKIEFWQGRASRLHDRMVFEKNSNNTWDLFRLNP